MNQEQSLYHQSLLQPITIGQIETKSCFSTNISQQGIKLKNRISMSAMTRGRCKDDNNIPDQDHAEYYSQRASAGFIVTESIPISNRTLAYPRSGGLYTNEQAEGWKKVVEKVHSKNGVIFAQLLHCGRQTHSSLINGQKPLAPSAVKIRGTNRVANQEYEEPQEMTISDIQQVQSEFKQAAEKAKSAGFDGIELNAGHGQLLDQFLRDSSNKRKDGYGGSIQNRSKFVLEVVKKVIEVYGSGRVGIKFTPISHTGDMNDSNPTELFQFILRELTILKIAYVVIKDENDPENSENFGYPASKTQMPCVFAPLRKFFGGVLIGNGIESVTKAEEDINQNKYDVVAFAKLYISNPDLVERVKYLYPISKQIDWNTAISGGAKGYTDYPVHNHTNQKFDILFTPLKMNDLTINNRITMSAMARMRCPAPYVPNDLLVEYYSQRATAGLVVAESTIISERSNAYPNSPGIYTDEQAKGWSRVVESVHNKGGKIFLQLYHSGRISHSELQNGLAPWAPSPIAIRGKCRMNNKDFEVPHEMTIDEIKQVIKEYVDATKRSKTAGFDGVEINGGHGSLVEQFLKDSSNKRSDVYGGSVENRCRFLLELINALNSVMPGRVSLKITPLTHANDMFDSQPVALYTHLLKEISKLNIKICYLTIKDDTDAENTDGYGYPASKTQVPDILKELRPHYKGILFINNGITPERAVEEIGQKKADAACIGKLFINNPDLVFKIRNGLELNTNYDFATFFGGNEKGYTDFAIHDGMK